ncbi:MAG: ABC transporter ATP-binding protein [Halobacteriales archaeon]
MSSDTEAMVELRDIRKEFGDIIAVDGIDLTIKRGEFFSLLGPSGCGKTTTLRMISGFERPTAGEVILNGRLANEIPPNQRDTNLVFQHLSLFPHMTVGENIGYGLKKAGVDEQERNELVSQYLELVDLEGFEDRDPTALSGGQQQRVALARALVNEPSVLLLDEPLGSLDRKLRQHMMVELRKIHEQVQGSFFYVTHNQEVAMTLSDRLAVMRDGKIEQVGTPEEIYREPATEFVADFIGDTNLFEGTTAKQNGTTTIQIGGPDGFSFSTQTAINGSEVTVSIRPEEFYLETDGDGVRAHIVEKYFQGDRTDYVVEPIDGDLPAIEVTEAGQEAQFDEGDEVRMTFDNSSPVVFQQS